MRRNISKTKDKINNIRDRHCLNFYSDTWPDRQLIQFRESEKIKKKNASGITGGYVTAQFRAPFASDACPCAISDNRQDRC